MYGGVGGVFGRGLLQRQRSILHQQACSSGVWALEERLGRLGDELGRSEVISVVSSESQYRLSIPKSSGWFRILSRRSWYSVSLPKAFGSVMGREKFEGLTKACSWLMIFTSHAEVSHLYVYSLL